MRRKKSLGIGSVILVFSIGIVSGVQVALYLFDRFDDGTADGRSLLIGMGMVLVGLALIAWMFRGRDGRKQHAD